MFGFFGFIVVIEKKEFDDLKVVRICEGFKEMIGGRCLFYNFIFMWY